MSLRFNARTNTLTSDGNPQIIVDGGVVEANVGLTASPDSGQGDGVITSFYNVYSTVATTGDAATLQATFSAGTVVYLKNDGANSMDVFPAPGDDAGAGGNNPVVLPAGESITFIATTTDATWTELIVPPSTGGGGGGDVTKVGTPANNQIGVWTGDGTIEGDANFQVIGTSFEGVLGNGPQLRNINGVNINPRKGDTNTGLQNVGDDRLAMVAGGVAGLTLVEASSGVIHNFDIDAAVTAFAGGGQGSATQLNQSYNIVTTVATTGDSVKLPPINHVGGLVYIKNDGANACDVFPAAGDDLGQGTNVALSVSAGAAVTFMHSVANTTWTQIQFEEVTGGDVTKVGTPANNQLAVWTGDGTLEGESNLTFDGTSVRLALFGGAFRGNLAAAGGVLNESATSTNPTLLPRMDDQTTGIGAAAVRNLHIIVDGDVAAFWQHTTSGNNEIRWINRLSTSISANTTQSQGNGLLNGGAFSEITTVANTDDVITLPSLASAGQWLTVINTGANRLQIFPATSDIILPNSVNDPVFLDADNSMTFVALDTQNWIIQAQPGGGGGDVTKVGTPANNQIGVWTGDGTIEGDSNFLLTGTQLTLPTGSSAGAPELKIGPGQTGFFAASNTQLRVTVDGTERFTFTSDRIQGFLAGSGQLHNRVSSATIPTFTPNTNDGNTGIGGAGNDTLSLIAGGDEIARAVEVAGANQFILTPGLIDNNPALPTLAFGDGDTGFYEAADDQLSVAILGARDWVFTSNVFGADQAAGPAMLNEDASSTNPTLVPNQADADTGIGRDTVDGLALIAGGVSCMRVREIAAAPAVGFYTTTPIVLQTGVAVSAAGVHAALVALGLITA